MADNENTENKGQYIGLGEAEINALVDRRFREREKEQQFADMVERLKEQTKELSEAEKIIDALTKSVNSLTEQMELKNSVRYYAGVAGELLESIGLPKAEISKKLSGLMGISMENQQAALPQKSTDNSGIVEDSPKQPVEKERGDAINTLREFMEGLPNKTIEDIYLIFSEIEKDNSISRQIINYLTDLKTKNNDNPPVHSED